MKKWFLKLFPWMCIPLLAWYVSNNWFQLMLIQGESMAPAYGHMQIVMLNRHDRTFESGDVVAFWCEDLSCVLVKRIAAVPGDTVIIRDGTLYVNGSVSEVYGEDNTFAYAGLLEEQIPLQSGQYLMLGDNTAQSIDSRYPQVGVVAETQIYGRIASWHQP